MTTYGQRGGDGPNTGKKATTYQCRGPDGQTWKRRIYSTHADPVFLFYQDRHKKAWFCAGVQDRNDSRFDADSRFGAYTKVAATPERGW